MTTYDHLIARIASDRGREVRSPSTEELVAYVTDSTEADTSAAIARANAAQPAWAALTDEARTGVLLAIADAIESSADSLARVLEAEQGKPRLTGAAHEVGGCVAWLRATASLPLPGEHLSAGEAQAEVRYRPVGVVGAITPWNFPMMIAVWQLAPSLRMGNTVVMKPSEYTTLSGLALAAVISDVVPAGVLEVVTGDGRVGDQIVRDPAVGKVMFTGSTNTGAKIVEASAENITRLTLELGGNDAGIVLPDADPGEIAEAIFWAAFMNSGQVCAALKRLYVHEGIYEEMVAALAEVARRVSAAPGGELGPLQNGMQFGIVDDLVEDARAAGARIVVGGQPDRGARGNYYPVTIVADISNDTALVQREQFGPALPVVKYSDVDQALTWANGVDVGLGGSVWARDLETARSVGRRLEAGTVWLNRHGSVNPFIPFGGAKRSGYGLEFGVDGLKAVAVPQVISE